MSQFKFVKLSALPEEAPSPPRHSSQVPTTFEGSNSPKPKTKTSTMTTAMSPAKNRFDVQVKLHNFGLDFENHTVKIPQDQELKKKRPVGDYTPPDEIDMFGAAAKRPKVLGDSSNSAESRLLQEQNSDVSLKSLDRVDREKQELKDKDKLRKQMYNDLHATSEEDEDEEDDEEEEENVEVVEPKPELSEFAKRQLAEKRRISREAQIRKNEEMNALKPPKYGEAIKVGGRVDVLKPERFWKHRNVLAVMQRHFSGPGREAAVQDRTKLMRAARELGVSAEMLYSRFAQEMEEAELKSKKPAELQDFDFEPLLTMKEYLDERRRGRAEKNFWKLSYVKVVVQKVRSREFTVDDGALWLGVSVKKFEGRVKTLDAIVEEEKKPRAPPKTALEKQVEKGKKEAERNDLCEYELVRLKNIEERLALFKSLHFEESKPKKAAGTKADAKPLEKRERSRRIQALAAKGSMGTSYLATVPPVPLAPALKMTDLFAIGVKQSIRNQLLSCLGREIADASKKSTVRIKPEGEDENETFAGTEFSLTESMTTALALYPDPNLSLVAGGDKNGAVSLWFHDAEISSKRARFFRYHPHSDTVNSLAFFPGAKHALISGCEEGTVKISDLESHEVTVVFNEPELDVTSVTPFPESAHELLVGAGSLIYHVDTRCKIGSAKAFRADLDFGPRENFTERRNSCFAYPTINHFHPIRHTLFTSPMASNEFKIFDLRNSQVEVDSIAFANPLSAEFSPDVGDKILLNSTLLPKDPVVANFVAGRALDLSAVKFESRPCRQPTAMWNPEDANEIFSVMKDKNKASDAVVGGFGVFKNEDGGLEMKANRVLERSSFGRDKINALGMVCGFGRLVTVNSSSLGSMNVFKYD